MTGSHRSYERSRRMAHGSVRRAILSGRLARALRADGLLDFDIADKELEASTRPAAPTMASRMNGNGHADPEAVATFLRARGAREAYMAQLARIEFERKTGTLVSAEEIKREAFEQARRARDLLLAIPERLGPMLGAAQRDALEAEIDRALDLVAGEPQGRAGPGIPRVGRPTPP